MMDDMCTKIKEGETSKKKRGHKPMERGATTTEAKQTPQNIVSHHSFRSRSILHFIEWYVVACHIPEANAALEGPD